MRAALNRRFPLDAVARWWYLLIAGAILGYVFSLATDWKPFSPLLKGKIAEGPPSNLQTSSMFVVQPEWKDDLFFTVLGFSIACGIIWLLEELRAPSGGERGP